MWFRLFAYPAVIMFLTSITIDGFGASLDNLEKQPISTISVLASSYDDLPQFRFALNLLRAGDYWDANIEFQRHIAYFPDTPRTDLSRYLIAEALFKAERWEEAFKAFAGYAPHATDISRIQKATIRQAQCLIALERYPIAYQILEMAHQQELKNIMPGLEGMSSLLEIDLLIHRKGFQEARLVANSLATSSPHTTAGKIAVAVITMLDDDAKRPRKSPAVGALLSTLLPGAGQWYAGYQSDARATATTILVHSLLATQARRSNHDRTAETLWAWDIGLYLGNVYGGRTAAKRHNEAIMASTQLAVTELLSTYLRNSQLDTSIWLQDSMLELQSSGCTITYVLEREIFAKAMLASGEYEVAEKEFRLIQNTAEEEATRYRAGFWRLYCLAQMNRWNRLLTSSKAYIQNVQDPAYKDASKMLEIIALLGQEQPTAAQEMCRQLTLSSSSSPLEELVGYLQGWVMLYNGDFSLARNCFWNISNTTHDILLADSARSISERLDGDETEIRLLDPARANHMSKFLPGSGHIYAGELRRGLASFAVNLTLADLAIKWSYSGFPLGAIMVAWQGKARFYDGAQWNAVRLTNKKNKETLKEFAHKISKSDRVDFLTKLASVIKKEEIKQSIDEPHKDISELP